MRVYTRTGDGGQTNLANGRRVAKDFPAVKAYGELDELNAVLGILRAEGAGEDNEPYLRRAQAVLFELGALLAGARGVELSADGRHVEWLEAWMDAMSQELSPLRHFVLPGGSRAASYAHWARTVCRRAERAVVALSREEPKAREGIPFLNRLGDALFILARYLNARAGCPEVLWNG